MKLRNGFVSNSSSASFILDKRELSKSQLKRIKKYIKDPDRNTDYWQITCDDDKFIKLYTIMDNSALSNFFETLNLLPGAIIDSYSE